MTNISTGRQRGIVPFVDETTGRLPDQYIPQRIIDLQGDLEQAVTDASASATAAKASETAAKASETAADSSAQAASTSSESARTASDSATSSKDAAAQSASQASASAQAAETSKTNAATSASAAKASETNAALSASAAASSETNAAASATAAQQAVDGFGLEVGTTTTGNSGTDAVVEIQKAGTKYTANFTIPRGDKGEKGDAPSLSRTMADPESHGWNAIDFNDFTENGVYTFNGTATNSPREDRWLTGTVIVSRSKRHIMQLCAYNPSTYSVGFALRDVASEDLSNVKWGQWRQIAFFDDLPNTTALANDIASLSTRVQALEARINSLENNQ